MGFGQAISQAAEKADANKRQAADANDPRLRIVHVALEDGPHGRVLVTFNRAITEAEFTVLVTKLRERAI